MKRVVWMPLLAGLAGCATPALQEAPPGQNAAQCPTSPLTIYQNLSDGAVSVTLHVVVDSPGCTLLLRWGPDEARYPAGTNLFITVRVPLAGSITGECVEQHRGVLRCRWTARVVSSSG